MSTSAYTETETSYIPKSPASLDELPFWGVHIRKRPYSARTGQLAEPDNPATFGPRAEAEQALALGRYDGLGVLVAESLRITVLDWDHVVPEDRAFDETAIPARVQRMIRMANTHTTWSFSGTGVRLFLAATTGQTYKNKTGKGNWIQAEQYTRGRFVTVLPDRRISGTPETFNPDHDDLIATLVAIGFAERAPEQEATPANEQSTRLDPPTSKWSGAGRTNQQVLETAFRAKNGDAIRRLYEGDITGYPESQGDPGFSSEADFAFIGYLAGYTQSDDQLADIWRSSGLSRKKLDRNDYVKLSIDTIRKDQTWSWDPNYGQTASRLTIVPPLAVGATCDEHLTHAQATIVLLTAQLQDAQQTIAMREGVIARERELRIAAEERAQRLGFERSQIMQILRNSDLGAGEKLTHFATVIDLGARIANGEVPAPAGFRLPAVAIAERTGQSVQTVRKHWNTLTKRGVLDKRNVRERTETDCVDPETGEISTATGMREVSHIHVPENNIIHLIVPAASYERPEQDTGHGGTRAPRCEEHPDAGTVKTWVIACAECEAVLDRGEAYRPADDDAESSPIKLIGEHNVSDTLLRATGQIPENPRPEASRGSPIKMTGAPPPEAEPAWRWEGVGS